MGECDSVLWQVRCARAALACRLELCVLTCACGRQLEELERATAMAESDYARFRIEKAELASRRSWNSSTRVQVEALKNTLAAAARDRKASSKPQGGRCVACSD